MRNLLCLLMVFAAVACTQDAYEKGEGAYSEMTAQLADAHVNSDKRVDYVDTDEGTLLFTGDMKLEEEYALLEAGLIPQAELLKVPFHGDNTASSPSFAEAVSPAAAVISDRLAKEVDFFSIGTNDLTQYTLACDRQNNDLGRFFNAHHPAVLRLIKMACDNAHKEGIWCGICGELGADLELTELFLSIGLDELSVSPRSVLPLRQKVRETQVRVVREKLVGDLMSDENTI